MLYLISIGLYNEKDLSLRALEAIKKCSRIYAEFYTSPVKVDIKNLEKTIGKKVEVLDRKQVEKSNLIIKEAKENNIGFLVPGDCFTATTHTAIALEAMKQKIPYEVIHSSSILTAVGECGLSLYRFGRVVSLPMSREGYEPETPYLNIRKNLENNLHTLLLLDIGMKANEAMKLLMENGIKDKIVVVSHLGKNSLIRYGGIGGLIDKDFGELPHSIIIPAKLEFYEKEFLEQFKV
jgi:diphthine synthase